MDVSQKKNCRDENQNLPKLEGWKAYLSLRSIVWTLKVY